MAPALRLLPGRGAAVAAAAAQGEVAAAHHRLLLAKAPWLAGSGATWKASDREVVATAAAPLRRTNCFQRRKSIKKSAGGAGKGAYVLYEAV